MNKLCDFILLFLAQLPLLTKVIQVRVRSQRLLWNQFFGFPKPKNLLSARETGSREAQTLCCSRIQEC